MTLAELIKTLESVDPGIRLPLGFQSPHSYRGDYAQLAFEPAQDVTVGSMLACAREAIGSTYVGYKGGDFVMKEWTDVYLANYGCCGEEIGPTLLRFMIQQGTKD